MLFIIVVDIVVGLNLPISMRGGGVKRFVNLRKNLRKYIKLNPNTCFQINYTLTL